MPGKQGSAGGSGRPMTEDDVRRIITSVMRSTNSQSASRGRSPAGRGLWPHTAAQGNLNDRRDGRGRSRSTKRSSSAAAEKRTKSRSRYPSSRPTQRNQQAPPHASGPGGCGEDNPATRKTNLPLDHKARPPAPLGDLESACIPAIELLRGRKDAGLRTYSSGDSEFNEHTATPTQRADRYYQTYGARIVPAGSDLVQAIILGASGYALQNISMQTSFDQLVKGTMTALSQRAEPVKSICNIFGLAWEDAILWHRELATCVAHMSDELYTPSLRATAMATSVLLGCSVRITSVLQGGSVRTMQFKEPKTLLELEYGSGERSCTIVMERNQYFTVMPVSVPDTASRNALREPATSLEDMRRFALCADSEINKHIASRLKEAIAAGYDRDDMRSDDDSTADREEEHNGEDVEMGASSSVSTATQAALAPSIAASSSGSSLRASAPAFPAAASSHQQQQQQQRSEFVATPGTRNRGIELMKGNRSLNTDEAMAMALRERHPTLVAAQNSGGSPNSGILKTTNGKRRGSGSVTFLDDSTRPATASTGNINSYTASARSELASRASVITNSRGASTSTGGTAVPPSSPMQSPTTGTTRSRTTGAAAQRLEFSTGRAGADAGAGAGSKSGTGSRMQQ